MTPVRNGLVRSAIMGAVVVLALGSSGGLALAQTPAGSEQPRVIRVVGTGESRATPDVAHIDLAVETTGTTAQAAAQQNAQAMERVIGAITSAGVVRADVQTRGYSLFPVYAHQASPNVPRQDGAPEEPRIVGYRASNTVTVRVQDVARVGALIDAGLGAGANRMDGLRFSIRDVEAARNQAVGQAAERARRSAEAMAAALGVRLGPLVEATTMPGYAQPLMFDRTMERAAMAAPTPVEPGEQSVTATVSLVFAIEG